MNTHTTPDNYDTSSSNAEGTEFPQVNQPSLAWCLSVLILLIGLLACAVFIYRSDSLTGASQSVLLFMTAFVWAVSIIRYKTPYKHMENQLGKSIGDISPTLLLLFMVGALSGTWMLSGIVPLLIDYGLKIISPSVFLPATCCICAIVSVMTGSSWATVATIGVALLGVGQAQGFSDGWIAGAIISGAYFGDKLSPMSDTTILASSSTDTPLFTHIEYMLFTTIPSLVIALIVFSVAGALHESAPGADTSLALARNIESTYRLSLWLLVVPLIVGWMVFKKLPSLAVIVAAAVMGAVTAVIAQPHLVLQVAPQGSPLSMLAGSLSAFFGPTAVETGNAVLNDLVSTGGMAGMLNTVWLIICAISFGSAMYASGMLQVLTAGIMRLARGAASLVASTVASTFLLNILTGDQFLAIVLSGRIFSNTYRDMGYESRLLSRSLEDGGTVTSVLVPWNTCGMTQSTVLGVSTLAYLPYCVFNYVSPLMSVLVAALGYKIVKPSKKSTTP